MTKPFDTSAARAAILNRIRTAQRRPASATVEELAAVVDYLARRPQGPRPAIEGDLSLRFRAMSERMSSTVDEVPHLADARRRRPATSPRSGCRCNDKGFSHSDSCVVNVNGRPVADAGTDQQVQSGDSVTLDGSGSTDGEDGALAYAWVQTSGPAVALSNPSSVRPSFLAPTAGAAGSTLTFRLTVTDSGGLQSGDSCTVTVSPQQEGGASGSSGGGGGGGGCFITAAGQ